MGGTIHKDEDYLVGQTWHLNNTIDELGGLRSLVELRVGYLDQGASHNLRRLPSVLALG